MMGKVNLLVFFAHLAEIPAKYSTLVFYCNVTTSQGLLRIQLMFVFTKQYLLLYIVQWFTDTIAIIFNSVGVLWNIFC